MEEPGDYKLLVYNNQADQYLIDDIQMTRNPIIRSAAVGEDPDQLAQWVDDTVSVNFDVINQTLWDRMEASLDCIREKYNSYRDLYDNPMSFYVAKKGGRFDEELFVLLWVDWAGNAPPPPSVLWTFE